MSDNLQAANNPDTRDDSLRLYGIIRRDIQMSPEKQMAQIGHAYTNTLLRSLRDNPLLALAYETPGCIGTKISLNAKSLDDLLDAHGAAQKAGIPCSLITDQGHIHLPDFDGSPVITALGIGPCTRDAAKRLTRRFKSTWRAA